MATVPEATGLRERKKEQTRARIAEVALELFDRQGFQATTIAEIAEQADVSPRTVSAYFPVKEDLAFPESTATFDRLEERFAARGPGETTADALRAWITLEAVAWDEHQDAVALQRRVIAAEPDLRAYEQRFMARADAIVSAAVAQDLGGLPTDLEPKMASAATLAIFGVLGAERQASEARALHDCAAPTDASSKAEALALLDRALTFVDAGIRALQAGR